MPDRSRSNDRALTAPHSTFFSKQQMGDYLHDLRANKLERPTGARPPPKSFVALRRAVFDTPADASNDAKPLAVAEPSPTSTTFQEPQKPSRIPSIKASQRGRPLVRNPVEAATVKLEGSPEMEEQQEPRLRYAESGTRWMEKQEVRSVSRALRDMDLKKEERLFKAAQAEASELVWKHQNPSAAYANPKAPYDYHSHLRKGSHIRSLSWARDSSVSKNKQGGERPSRSTSRSGSRSASGGSKNSGTNSSRVPSDSSLKAPASPITPVEDTFVEDACEPKKRSVHFAPEESSVKKDDGPSHPPNRKVTPPRAVDGISSDEVKVSNFAVAARMASNAVPIHFRNPFSRVKLAKASLHRTGTEPLPGVRKFNKVEIQRNPPSQSRNPDYTTNSAVVDLDSSKLDEEVRMKDGREIRSDEIRKATSMNLKDRSPHLPTPTMVSDSPDRPIVSFDKDWNPREIQLQVAESMLDRKPSRMDPEPCMKRSNTEPTSKAYPPAPAVPSIAIADTSSTESCASITQPPIIPIIQVDDMPSIPTIAVNNIPSISINPPSMTINGTPSVSISPPSISINDTPATSISNPPTISISTASIPDPPSRPLPTKPQKHITRSSQAPSGAPLCATCGLPISGRTVTAASSLFHPPCFRCYTCSSALECIAFYPEPSSERSARLADPSADSSPRFYCHLDYHELFSPRCRTCRTPIEGKVVVALGSTYHEGHFFCAQCGDPFTADTPFVEKDGYAWCVGCHTRRFSGKCKRCRQPIIETVVSALGAEWCEGCFCCAECKGPFTDGRYFLRPGVAEPFCPACEERRVKELAG